MNPHAIRVTSQPSYLEFAPFSSAIAPGVVKLRNKMGYCCTFEVEGVDFETCGDESIDTYNFALEKAIRALDPGCQLWIHKIKSKEIEHFKPELRNEVCKTNSEEYL